MISKKKVSKKPHPSAASRANQSFSLLQRFWICHCNSDVPSGASSSKSSSKGAAVRRANSFPEIWMLTQPLSGPVPFLNAWEMLGEIWGNIG